MTTAPTPQPEALRLADELMEPTLWPNDIRNLGADMLRRLQAENERLQGSLEAQRLISDQAIALAKELEASKNARIHELEMQALDLASENSILKRQEQEELEARKPLPLSDDDRLRLRSDVARAIWDVMREHDDRCGHALEDVEPKHQVWDCADAAIKAVHGITGGSS